MQGRIRKLNRTTLAVGLSLMLTAGAAHAENVLTLKRSSSNTISLELSNDDPIAGFQFSINTRGGLGLESFIAAARLQGAGVSVFQYVENDSTLNVVLLAPVRASLPRGTGAIGVIQCSSGKSSAADTHRVFLSRVAVCNANAQMLDISDKPLSWSANQGSNSIATITLDQNFPNPFNPSTTISYCLERDSRVRLAVYDVTGREVALLIDQHQSAGRHSVQWNVLQGGRIALASGLYFAHLTAGGSTAVSKMVLAK